jgi:hypothetical protein
MTNLILRTLLALLALSFFSNTFLKFIRGEKSQTVFKLLTSLVIWGGVFVFSVFPNFTHSISANLGFGENLNTLIFFGFIIIFLILTKIISIIERIEKNISEIVRKEALSILDQSEKD